MLGFKKIFTDHRLFLGAALLLIPPQLAAGACNNRFNRCNNRLNQNQTRDHFKTDIPFNSSWSMVA